MIQLPRSVAPACLLLLGFLAHGLSSQHTALGQDGFRPMFSDAELSGWVRTNTPQETWRFEDGILYCTGKPIGEIRTAKMYQNFVMELEWRHLVPRGNAGVFVWADDITSRGVPFHRGIEVQVLENAYGNTKSHTTHGDIFPIHGATMTPINGRGGSRAFPTESLSNPSPQWNRYRIECRDGEISLAVNGTVVTRGKDCVPRKGYICLESEGGVVEYRNVRIKELPGGEVPADQVAIADRGYHSLYTGLNLDGWDADDVSQWNVKDWVLAFEADPGTTGTLATTRSFDNASFVVDVRLKDAESNVVIQAGGNLQIDLSDPASATHLEKPGRWNRIEVIAKDGKRVVHLNGQPAVSSQSDDGASDKLVLSPSGSVDFANLYAAE
ncbi:hypothetical protein Enr13x_76850 [Stieleria neptunia]|uniref:3-keto-alpha-glucoside-1,2-lyase/3-keto-2-hydroxy-glucal hydratase domain-containing protein n=1 Tax=Stieleria neptunia TaxID=2527979 RepID=A0A518I3T9_9BACT|nr:family 16 glycoside hydrolase [Stieleria neptunia]QDV47773.1 hypothetical protein Enr13x_76850 [Stieleria neptunia]